MDVYGHRFSFAGVFYPISVLRWAQNVAHCIPVSYVFGDAVNHKRESSSTLQSLLAINPLYGLSWYRLTMLYNSYRAILKRGLISVE